MLDERKIVFVSASGRRQPDWLGIWLTLAAGTIWKENTMRTRVKYSALFVLLIGCSGAGAANLARGIDALDRGAYSAALKEFRPLADAGNARAEYRLGTMFAKGLGVPFDYKRAAYWLHQAAMQGNAHAQNDLGVLYDLGWGVPVDAKQGARWFRKAAEQGIGAAQLILASLYQQGRGVPANPVEAFAWANAAADLGEFGAQKLVDAIGKSMSSTQIDQAERRAECYRQKYVSPFRKS